MRRTHLCVCCVTFAAPEGLVGMLVQVQWTNNSYLGDVLAYHKLSDRHLVSYQEDGDRKWHHLSGSDSKQFEVVGPSAEGWDTKYV